MPPLINLIVVPPPMEDVIHSFLFFCSCVHFVCFFMSSITHKVKSDFEEMLAEDADWDKEETIRFWK